MKILICPKCKSDSIILNLGGETGKYECKKCGYISTLIIEKEIKNG
jgi:transposase-like protein